MCHVHFHLWYVLSFVLSFALPFFCTGILSQLFRLLYFLLLWSFYLSFALLCIFPSFDLIFLLQFLFTFIFWAPSLLIQMALSIGLAYMQCMQPCSVFQAVMLVRILHDSGKLLQKPLLFVQSLLYTPRLVMIELFDILQSPLSSMKEEKPGF